MSISIYWQIFKFNASYFLVYPSEIILFIIRKSVDLGLLLLFWSLVNAPGTNLKDLLSYFLIATAVSEITMGYLLELGNNIKRMVRSGALSGYLIKPLNIIPSLYFMYMGNRILISIFSIITIIIGVIINGHISILSFILFIIYTMIASIISLAFNLFIAIIAVGISWETADPIVNVFRFISRLVSGTMIPLAFFPDAVKQVLENLPFAYLVSYPTLIIKSSSVNLSIEFNHIVIGIVWCVILMILMFYLWGKSLKRYEASGM